MILSCPSWTSAVCCCSACRAALLDDESRFLEHTATSNRPLAHVSVSKNKLQDCCVCLTAPLNFRMLSRDCHVGLLLQDVLFCDLARWSDAAVSFGVSLINKGVEMSVSAGCLTRGDRQVVISSSSIIVTGRYQSNFLLVV